MSSDNNLQEMEAGTTQSKTAVNAGAKAGDPMQKLAPGAVAGQTGSYEDLGGPTPDNYKSDDESAGEDPRRNPQAGTRRCKQRCKTCGCNEGYEGRGRTRF